MYRLQKDLHGEFLPNPLAKCSPYSWEVWPYRGLYRSDPERFDTLRPLASTPDQKTVPFPLLLSTDDTDGNMPQLRYPMKNSRPWPAAASLIKIPCPCRYLRLFLRHSSFRLWFYLGKENHFPLFPQDEIP